MYKIDKQENKITQIQQRTFSELGFKERENLQEWIANEPDVLGEELLIIQKEFSGFDDTNERLDLLAVDKQGALVIIENKLDDSGKDVTWQALKYTSYCSGLSKENIRKIYQDYLDKTTKNEKAEENLSDFRGGIDYDDLTLNKGVTQRIILIAAKFRKEVTSTVLWLLNYKVRLQCFKATAYSMGDELFLTVDQIIPTQDAEDYMIGMAEKAQDEIESDTVSNRRHVLRKEFWSKLIQTMNTKSSLYKNISTTVYHWIGAGSGVRGLSLNFVATKSYGRAEFYIDRGKNSKQENKFIYDEFMKVRKEIESNYDGKLTWERMDNRRASRIKAEISGDVFDRDCWDEMIVFMTDSMVKMEKALKPFIQSIDQKLKNFQPVSKEIIS